jgi:hypothetical protein
MNLEAKQMLTVGTRPNMTRRPDAEGDDGRRA